MSRVANRPSPASGPVTRLRPTSQRSSWRLRRVASRLSATASGSVREGREAPSLSCEDITDDTKVESFCRNDSADSRSCTDVESSGGA